MRLANATTSCIMQVIVFGAAKVPLSYNNPCHAGRFGKMGSPMILSYACIILLHQLEATAKRIVLLLHA